MLQPATNPVRLTLIGVPGSEFREAAEIARQSGAVVSQADSGQAALDQLRKGSGDLVMIDVALDATGFIAGLRAERIAIPVIACGVDAPADKAVAAIRAGARDYLPLPPHRELIAAAIGSVAQMPVEMIGECPEMAKAMAFATSMAPADAPMLLRGEMGTGKEMLARSIHVASGRSGHFVSVECEGVAEQVIESELFGHDRGAFEGAIAARTGRLEEAVDGTIYLREIGALPARIQARLFEAMRTGQIQKMGGGEPVPLKARIIAGSSVDLAEKVADSGFRADLLKRLSMAEITLPPLRERGQDIRLLTRHFAIDIARKNGMQAGRFSDDAYTTMARYDWPGNVSELEQLVHRAMLMAKGREIGSDDLVLADGSPLNLYLSREEGGRGGLLIDNLVGHSMADVERELILQTLEHCRGNRTSASSILGISVRTMRNKLRSFIEAGIPVEPAQ